MLGGRGMRNQEEQSLKEAGRLAKKQARRKSDSAREEAIAEGQEARKLKYNK
jgi:hypothetical protein